MKFTLHFLLHFKPIQQILSMKHLQQAVLSLGMKKERKKKKEQIHSQELTALCKATYNSI